MGVFLELVELASWKDAFTRDIRERAREGSGCEATKKYLALEDGTEVGYLALDWWPIALCRDLVVYEMFVPEKFRHRGVGSRILEEAEKLARAGGYLRVFLIAQPLEDYYPREQLVAWYQRLGFRAVPPTRLRVQWQRICPESTSTSAP